MIWFELTGDNTGSSPVLSYNLQWDAGTNAATWTDLIGDGVVSPYSTATAYLFSDNVFAGTTYKMRIRAYNIHGWSEWSSILITHSTGIPDKPLPATTSVNNKFIRVSWVAPNNNYEALDAFKIKISTSDVEQYVEDLTYCNGANAVTFERLYCEVPVSLFSDPAYLFKLQAGFEIKAIVAAHNSNGWGPYSEPTIVGQTLKTIPSKMYLPTRDPQTTELKLVVDWLP